MTEPVGSGPDARHLEVLATSRHRSALLEAAVHAWWVRPGTWVRAGASAVLLLAGLRLYAAPWALAVLVAVVVPATFLVLARMRFGRVVGRRLAESWADGTVHGTVFDEAGFVSRGPLGAVEYRRPVVAAVQRRGEVVQVRLRPRGTVLVVGELFPVEEEEGLAGVHHP